MEKKLVLDSGETREQLADIVATKINKGKECFLFIIIQLDKNRIGLKAPIWVPNEIVTKKKLLQWSFRIINQDKLIGKYIIVILSAAKNPLINQFKMSRLQYGGQIMDPSPSPSTILRVRVRMTKHEVFSSIIHPLSLRLPSCVNQQAPSFH